MVGDDILHEVRIRLYGKEKARTHAEHTAVYEHWAGAFDAAKPHAAKPHAAKPHAAKPHAAKPHAARQTEAHFIREILKVSEE